MDWRQVLRTNVTQIFFVCGAFFLMVIISCISVSIVIQREVESTVNVALGETEKSFQSYLHEPRIAFGHIYLTVQEMLDNGASQEEIRSYLRHITRTMESQNSNVRGFISVYGLIRDELLDSSSFTPSDAFVPQERPWHQTAIRSQGASYTAPYRDLRNQKTIISLAQELHGKNGENYGVLALDVDLSWMLETAKSMELVEGGYGMIVNQLLYIIAHPAKEFLYRPLQSLSPDYISIAEDLRTAQSLSGRRVANYAGTSSIVFFRKLYNGWYIGVSLPVSSYYASLYPTALFLALMGIVLSVALSLLLLRLSAAKMQSDTENRFKSSFLAMMSHEIRTPLNAIIGLSEAQLQKQLPETVRSDVAAIFHSGSNLLGIINDILDFSKLNAGGFTLVPVQYDMLSLINDTVQLNAVRLAGRPVTLQLDIDPSLPSYLYGDELRVKQILNNLLSNAIKYTNKGTVTLGIHWEKQNGDAMLFLTVRDTGIGIKKADMDKLFSEYGQIDLMKNRTREGTGLGLAITKRLVERMDGAISAESEYGKGSAFTAGVLQHIIDETPIGDAVVKDLAQFRFADERRTRQRVLARTQMPKARVLVVDDIITNLNVARSLLSPYGMAVDCVQSGAEAVEAIKDATVHYDAIFMDHMMPEMDGVEATRIIRNDIGTEYAGDIPIIALTANALAGNEELFLAKGFNAFISKPINTRILDAVVKEWIEARQPEASLRRPDSAVPGIGAGAGESPFAEVFADARFEHIMYNDLLQRYDNDEEICFSVLQSYARHTPDLLETLREPLEGALPAYAVAVHGLKGSSWGIGAHGVGNAAAALEQAAKRGDFKTVAADTPALLAMVHALLAELDVFLHMADSAAGTAKPVSEHIDHQILTELLEACRNFDALSMEDIMIRLEANAYADPADAALLGWLHEQVDSLEYDEIEARLAQVLEKR